MHKVNKTTEKFNHIMKEVAQFGLYDRNRIIYYLVKEKGWTLQQVANILGLTRQRISKIVIDFDKNCEPF